MTQKGTDNKGALYYQF